MAERGFMRMFAEPFNQQQQLQQAITTTATCRSLIKYNSTLNTEQKNEILGEIDSTLAFLTQRLATNGAFEAEPTLLPEKLLNLLEEDDTDSLAGQHQFLTPEEQKIQAHEISLKNLYKIYHEYLTEEPNAGIAMLEARYKTIMGALDYVQNEGMA